MAEHELLSAGEVLVERYRIRGQLGAGGMGVVYRAADVRLEGRDVAIKVLSEQPESATGKRFRREAKILASIRHPHVVKIHELDVLDDGRPFIAMEYLDGETLAERNAREALDVDEVRELLRQICDALGAIHDRGVVHRDLKPQNIFLKNTDDGSMHALVLDFGIAKSLGTATVKTATTEIVGTPQYMAPEQAKGAHELISPRTDVFALGTIAYELIAGKSPFDGESVYEIVFRVTDHQPPRLESETGCPANLAAAIAVAMSKEPIARFATAAEFAAATVADEPAEVPEAAPKPDDKPTVNERLPTKDETPVPRPRWLWAIPTVAVVGIGLGLLAWRGGNNPLVDPETSSYYETLRDADVAYELAVDGEHMSVADRLLEAYRVGDDRITTRFALGRAVWPADALTRSYELKNPVNRIAFDGGSAIVLAGLGAYRPGESTPLNSYRDVESAVVSPSGKLALLLRNTEVSVVDLSRGSVVRVIEGEPFLRGAFVDDESFVVWTSLAAKRKVFRRIGVADGVVQWEANCPPGPSGLDIADGLDLLVACAPVRRISLTTGVSKPLGLKEPLSSVHPNNAITVSDSGRRVIARTGDKTYYIDGDNQAVEIAALNDVGRIEFFDDDRAIVFDGTRVSILRFAEGTYKSLWTQTLTATVSRWLKTPGGALAVATTDGYVSILSPGTGLRLVTWRAHADGISGLGLAGTSLFTASGRRVSEWDLRALPIDLLAEGDVDEAYVDRQAEHAVLRRGKRWARVDIASREVVDMFESSEHGFVPRDGHLLFIGPRAYRFATGEFLFELPGVKRITSSSRNGSLVAPEPFSAGLFAIDDDQFKKTALSTKAWSFGVVSEGGSSVAGQPQRPDGFTMFDVRSGRIIHERKKQVLFSLTETYALVRTITASGSELRAWRWQSDDFDVLPTNAKVDLTSRAYAYFEDDVLHYRDAGVVRASTRAICPGRQLMLTESGKVAFNCQAREQIYFWDSENPVLPLWPRQRGKRSFIDPMLSADGRTAFAVERNGLMRMSVSLEDRGPDEIQAKIDRYRRLIK